MGVDSWLRLSLAVADVVNVLVKHGVESALVDAFRLITFRSFAVFDVFLVQNSGLACLLLRSFHLLEDVYLVENGVCEFILEIFGVQDLLDHIFDERERADLVDVRPFLSAGVKHMLKEQFKFVRVLGRHVLVLAFHD